MRRTICAVMMMVVASTAEAQQARNDGSFLYEQCNILALAREDLSDVKGLDFGKAMFCAGYLRALHTTLARIHDHYKVIFPKYGAWKDETFAKGWFATQVLLAFDVCFPRNIRPKMLAMIISKFAKEHPEQLTTDMFTFAGQAFQSVYAPKGPTDECARM